VAGWIDRHARGGLQRATILLGSRALGGAGTAGE
jgi:hypothetical protein